MPDPAARLRAAGLRATPGRVRALAAIEAAPAPLTHADLARLPALADLDAITLYRLLDAFAERGLVHRVQGTDGVWRTCAQPAGQPGCPGNHAHFLCAACGAMACLTDQPLPHVRAPEGATVQTRQLLAVGRCAACAPPETAVQSQGEAS